MNHHDISSFQELFKENRYLRLKNYLYNYLIRKRAIKKCLHYDNPELMLEVGSGISPLVADFSNIVYSDVSFEAIHVLKGTRKKGYYVVADVTKLPFKSDTFTHTVCSEVLEHVKDDRQAIGEIYRTLKNSKGCFVVTVPHRKGYFSCDDRYVNHYRRYELAEIIGRLQSTGLEPILIQKIMGPLEKITMIAAVLIFSTINRRIPVKVSMAETSGSRHLNLLISFFKWTNTFYMGYVWLDAKIMPWSFATVILIKSTTSPKK